jgi:hypothetical protein
MATAFTDSTDQLADGFPQDKSLWHDAAPRRLKALSSQADPQRRWKVWQRHLNRRKQPATPPFLDGKTPPILWAWPDSWLRDDLSAALDSLGEQSDIVDLGDGLPEDLPTALRTVALAYALPGLAAKLSSEAWWKLADGLRVLATDAQQLGVRWESDPHDVLAGELPLVLGYLFPEVRSLRALRKPARKALSEAILEVTDGRGVPHTRLLPALAPLWACWTRCRWLGKRLKQGCWSRDAETQYEWLVRRVIRLSDGERRLALCGAEPHDAPVLPKQLFSTALELAGDSADYAAAAGAVSRSILPAGVDFDEEDLPKPSFNSEWSGVAVLATGWSRRGPRLALAYADDPHRIELSVGGRPLLSGAWTTQTICDGDLIPIVGEWEELLWRSDADVDYLELGVDLADGLRIERQILLARQDHVLFLADNLVVDDDPPRTLRHSLHLPLAPEVAWLPESDTRDGVLADAKPRAAVIPPALHEWRADPRGGSLVCQEDRLTLTQQATGRALCCPLFFDFRPRRIEKQRTWRQLTVAEKLAVVPHDVAVGFRVQSDRDQWLMYRTLGPPGNRTLMGQNISSEFYAGRFLKTGEVDEWIEVEPSES